MVLWKVYAVLLIRGTKSNKRPNGVNCFESSLKPQDQLEQTRNVHWMAPWKKFFVDQRYKKLQKGVVCFESSSLKPLGQLEPKLVGIFIGMFCKKFLFVDLKYTFETRGPNVSKRVSSIFVYGPFIFQLILIGFYSLCEIGK